jgi:peptidoglycan hydrolase-like protein with peptidoglycan-binding domain
VRTDDPFAELTLESYPELEASSGSELEAFAESESEAPGGVPSRGSREYVAWVQGALNRAMGLRLAADGNMGLATRSAIRSFQQKIGLPADGVAGPATEAALQAAAAGRSAAGPTVQAPAGKMHFGVDFGSVDGNLNPDWAKARDQGPTSFAIIRFDSRFAREWPRIKDAGIVRGAYLFLNFPWKKYPHPPDPETQANAFCSKVKLEPTDFPPSLDVEFPDGRQGTGMTAPQLLDGVRAAWRVLKGFYKAAPMIYTSARVWREDLLNLGASDLTESPLWLAKPYLLNAHQPALRTAKTFGPDGRKFSPRVPPPWREADNWWIHQYQGDAWSFPGFRQVDVNRFNTMATGAQGERVKWVQRRLGIAQSGAFDAATRTAVGRLQSKNGLPVTFEIDPRTFALVSWMNA